MKLNKNYKELTTSLLFILTSYISFSYSNLFYNSTHSPDFYKYKNYFDYYAGIKDSTSLEQGNLYFYFVSKIIESRSNILNLRNFYEGISNSIQLANMIIYLVGILGIYKLLSHRNYSKIKIIFSLSVLNFFPPAIALRLILKPEILIFTLFVWSLYCFEVYLKNKNTLMLYNFVALLSIIVSTKASTGIIVLLFYLVYFYKEILTENIKTIFLVFFMFMFLFSCLSYENYLINDVLFYDHKISEDYNFTADASFLYNLSLKNIIYNPYPEFHNNSLIGIVALETFNDHFNLYWNSDESVFAQGSIIFLKKNLKIYLAILLTLLFYLTALNLSRKERKLYTLSPLIGIFVMTIFSLFVLFEPESGDMLKNYYYSFLLILSFTFILNYYLNKNNIFYIVFIVLAISTFFIFGFPKAYDSLMVERINLQNETSPTCEVNSFLIGNVENNCYKHGDSFCEDIFKDFTKPELVNGLLVENKYEKLATYEFEKANVSKELKDYGDCKKYINNGWEPKNLFMMKNRMPVFSVILFLYLIFSSLLAKNTKRKT
tara:strand:- start:3162 stop:4799 length:1638 start_codon:yes stop_codon:yes gene_type:complete